MAGGCRGLVLGDLNPEQLATAQEELSALGDGEVVTVTMDAGKLEDVQRLLDDTLSVCATHPRDVFCRLRLQHTLVGAAGWNVHCTHAPLADSSGS